MRRAPAHIRKELAAAVPEKKGRPRRSRRGQERIVTAEAHYQSETLMKHEALERHLAEFRRNPPTRMDIPITTGGVIRYGLSPRDIAKRKAMDRDRGLQLKRRRALVRSKMLDHQRAREDEILRAVWKLGI